MKCLCLEAISCIFYYQRIFKFARWFFLNSQTINSRRAKLIWTSLMNDRIKIICLRIHSNIITKYQNVSLPIWHLLKNILEPLLPIQISIKHYLDINHDWVLFFFPFGNILAWDLSMQLWNLDCIKTKKS